MHGRELLLGSASECASSSQRQIVEEVSEIFIEPGHCCCCALSEIENRAAGGWRTDGRRFPNRPGRPPPASTT